MKPSKFFSLNKQDWIKGLIMAIGAPLIYYIISIIPQLNLSPETAAIATTILTYLAKNFFTPTPSAIQIDPSKTAVIDSQTKSPIIKTN